MKINDEMKGTMAFASIILAISLAFAFYLFGIIGARVVMGILMVSAPFYLMLSQFNLGEGEKFVFSFLLGMTLFPSFVFLLGLVMPFRLAIAAVFIILVAAALALAKYKK